MFDALKQGGVVVIGGSGGLGVEICRTFAKIGSAVAFNYHGRIERAGRLHAELSQASRRSLMRQADLLDIGSVRELFVSAEAEFGSIHTVVYASGPTVRISAQIGTARRKTTLL